MPSSKRVARSKTSYICQDSVVRVRPVLRATVGMAVFKSVKRLIHRGVPLAWVIEDLLIEALTARGITFRRSDTAQCIVRRVGKSAPALLLMAQICSTSAADHDLLTFSASWHTDRDLHRNEVNPGIGYAWRDQPWAPERVASVGGASTVGVRVWRRAWLHPA